MSHYLMFLGINCQFFSRLGLKCQKACPVRNIFSTVLFYFHILEVFLPLECQPLIC